MKKSDEDPSTVLALLISCNCYPFPLGTNLACESPSNYRPLPRRLTGAFSMASVDDFEATEARSGEPKDSNMGSAMQAPVPRKKWRRLILSLISISLALLFSVQLMLTTLSNNDQAR